MQAKINVLGFPLKKLQNIFAEFHFTNLDAKKAVQWIHNKLATDFESMTDISLQTREKLSDVFSLSRPQLQLLQESSDGTLKALLSLEDNQTIETVFIPDEERNTICLSSQVGCAVGCKFCNTGTQKLLRNLSASEILAQVFFWKDYIQQSHWQEKHGKKSITNIVFMGMGEPLFNAENLFDALSLLLDEKRHNFSRNKITVSTAGVIDDNLDKLSEFGVKLAISLHAPNDTLRTSIMPINKKYNIQAIISAANKYLSLSNTLHVTFEYLLLSGVNDSDDHARELARVLKHTKSKVNLIMFNKWPGSIFQGSTQERANAFSKVLLSSNIRTIIRKSRGSDILAACGQLKTESDKQQP